MDARNTAIFTRKNTEDTPKKNLEKKRMRKIERNKNFPNSNQKNK